MTSAFATSPFPTCPTPFNMAAHVLAQADSHPDKTALSVVSPDGRHDWTFGALQHAVLGLASALRVTGLEPGDSVLLRLGNVVEFPIAFLGCIAAGLVPVPLSALLTAAEVEAACTVLSPKAMILDPNLPVPPSSELPIIDLPKLRDMFDHRPAGFDYGDPNRLGYILFTSGTSGTPRAVCHAHRAVWARDMMVAGWTDLRPTDRILHAGAFNWSFTLGTGLMDPWRVGATALIPAPKVTTEQLPELLRQHEATIFAAVPGIYRKILKSNTDLALPKLRHGLSAGEKLSPTIRQAWHKATGGLDIYEAYGMTECSTFISAHPKTPAKDGSLGRVQAGRQVAIVDENGNISPCEKGQIAIHKDEPGLMLGYFGAPQETQARFVGDWFLTGDLAQQNPDGQIVYAGRADDMMNAGGYRVSPLEVEQALAGFPDLLQIGVTDVEVKTDVRIIAGFVVGETALDINALSVYTAARLAAYKCPKVWIQLPSLPTNSNGKLARKALKDLYKSA